MRKVRIQWYPGHHAALRIMSRRAKEEDIRLFARSKSGFTEQADRERVDSILQVSSTANVELYRKLYKEDQNMCETLMEIMKDDIDKKIRQSEKKAEKRGEKRGALLTLKELVKDGILSLTEAAKRAGMSVNEFKVQAGIK